jgi:hypothetical protein
LTQEQPHERVYFISNLVEKPSTAGLNELSRHLATQAPDAHVYTKLFKPEYFKYRHMLEDAGWCQADQVNENNESYYLHFVYKPHA